MFEFEIMDMTCGHCVGAITKAVEQVAPDAILSFDLPTHRVKLTQVSDIAPIEAAIRVAGYTAVAV